MKLFTKLKELIFREPVNKNVPQKAAAVLRIASIGIILYLLCMLIGVIFARSPLLIAITLVLISVFFYALYITYDDKMTESLVLFNVASVFFVVLFYIVFGADIGVQGVVFVVVLVDLLLWRKYQMHTILVWYVIRIGLYIYGEYQPELLAFHEKTEIAFCVLSILLEALAVVFTGLYFTKDAFSMERRLQEYNKELEHVASTDPLTKLWNRFKMIEHANRCVRRYNRSEMNFMSIAIGDIDFFKRFNDTYGHECGDKVLQSLANLFSKEMAGHGAVARWGGEEFLFVLENMNGDDAHTFLINLQRKLNQLEIPYENEILRVHMTFGLCEYDFNLSLDDNIKISDDRLYKGKANGRNCIIY